MTSLADMKHLILIDNAKKKKNTYNNHNLKKINKYIFTNKNYGLFWKKINNLVI